MERIDQEDAEAYPFVGIFDCDGLNRGPINSASILEAIRFLSEEPSRAAAPTNQRGFYYDIWALRHEAWCPGDCEQEYKTWYEMGFSHEAQWARVGSRQVHIPPSAKPIEVKSGFGSFAVYKAEFLRGCRRFH